MRITSIALSALFAVLLVSFSASAAETNAYVKIQHGGSWITKSGSLFDDPVSCGTNCLRYETNMNAYCDDVDGVEAKVNSSNVLPIHGNWSYTEDNGYDWDPTEVETNYFHAPYFDEFGNYHPGVNYTLGQEATAYSSEDLCNNELFLSVAYVFTGGGMQVYTYRKYNL
jgi:hypothetical protein